MSNAFEVYQKTRTGRELGYVINRPDRILELRLFSYHGWPAIDAVSKEISPIIQKLVIEADQEEARNFADRLVEQRMLGAGFVVARDDRPSMGVVWRRERPVDIVEQPGPITEAGTVELGVERDNHGAIIGRWRLSLTALPPALLQHEIKGFRAPIEQAFQDAYRYADRYGFATLYINDRENCFRTTRDKPFCPL